MRKAFLSFGSLEMEIVGDVIYPPRYSRNVLWARLDTIRHDVVWLRSGLVICSWEEGDKQAIQRSRGETQ